MQLFKGRKFRIGKVMFHFNINLDHVNGGIPIIPTLTIWYNKFYLNILSCSLTIRGLYEWEKPIIDQFKKANSDPEDGPQCRLDKFVLGECGSGDNFKFDSKSTNIFFEQHANYNDFIRKNIFFRPAQGKVVIPEPDI